MVRTRGLLVVGAIAAGAAAIAVVMRRPGTAAGTAPAVQRLPALRHFVTHRFNPVVERLGLVGGRRSFWAMVEHVGRTSGTVRRTPVLPRFTETAAYIPLPYGTDVHWARNVLAAGHCRLQVHGRVHELDEPRIVGVDENLSLSPLARRIAARRGYGYLALHRQADAPGTLDRPAVVVEPAAPAPASADAEAIQLAAAR